ncbi:uncharacterized protein BDZ99DRAFT_573913 [Mytilinidion resinicola]|uniref:Uncharacterized protein n=1 Tax=Mytilinidion resinicola TaxID=574789 RepID=A0A6A6YC62_9PEZI|nr:uncharacterized protein BDZ99DRAFT_573913 [Mytilinidion resinicola]KAF2806392.1 hypothetical protein BDZ99DRAFT_573913 [Mytilinidion resinicola]
MAPRFARIMLAISSFHSFTSAFPSQGSFIGITACSTNFSRNMTEMTLPQCYSLCGTGWASYDKWDALTSILTWVVPLFVLVGNMHFSHFDVAVYKKIPDQRWWYAARRIVVNGGRSLLFNYAFVILHLLADPIDTIWSLLDKLAFAKKTRAYIHEQISHPSHPPVPMATAKGNITITLRGLSTQLSAPPLTPHALKNLQIVLFALDDFSPSPSILTLLHLLHHPALPPHRREKLLETLAHTATLLTHTRIKSARRAALAVTAYAYPLFTSVASGAAASSTPTHFPHTIALRELYYWLIPTIALSSAAGAWPTEKTAGVALQPLVREVNLVTREVELKGEEMALGTPRPWNGAVYTWRPRKRVRCWEDVGMLGSAFAVVAGAWGFSFVMSVVTPTRGLGCRAVTEVGYFAAWCVNFLMTQGVCLWWGRGGRGGGRWGEGGEEKDGRARGLFVVVLVKDAVFAVPMTLILFLAFKGWWNSCDCWSARWSLGFANARVPLGLAAWEKQHDYLYYALIGGALGFQVLAAVCMVGWNRGVLRLIYGEAEKANEIRVPKGKE